MRSVLRDILLSFCPASVRRDSKAESSGRVVFAATWIGLLQFVLLAYLLVVRYLDFLAARTKLWAPHVAGASEAVQSGVLIIATLEFLIYPLSLLLLYFCLEGAARFLGGLIASEVVPSWPVVLAFKIKVAIVQRRERLRVSALPPDAVTALPDGRLRIATAHARPSWSNPSLTIGIGGEHYELERVDRGALPHPFVFFLRRAPLGKILRAYEEYDAGPARPPE